MLGRLVPALASALLLLAPLARLLPSGGDRFAAIRDAIPRRLAEEGVASLAVAVARDGRILWEEGFGWADRERGIAATPHTPYPVASVSKAMTATGLMILRERGSIDLDRPINDYLGEARLKAWVGDADRASVRRVANHTAGLPLHHHFFPEPRRPPPMPETIRRYGHLVAAPGEGFQYSNLGYGILEFLISRVSGRPFADFMRDEVFLPLGLTRTSVGIGEGLEDLAAARYGPDGQALPFYDFDHRGASAVFSSVHDLARFGSFQVKARLPDQRAVLSARALDEMQKPMVERPEGGGYGIGWETFELRGHRVVLHRGGMGGVSSVLALVPTERLVVAAVANARSDLPQLLAGEILRRLLPPHPLASLQADPAGDWPGAQPPRRAPRFKPPRGLIAAWSGAVHTHEAVLPLLLCIEGSGAVRARLATQPETRLSGVALRGGRLTALFPGDIGTEDTPRQGQLLALSLRQRGEVLNGSVTAHSESTPGLPNALSHFVELRKRGSPCAATAEGVP